MNKGVIVMVKKIGMLFICMCLLMNISIAESSDEIRFTLEDAIKYGLEHNTKLIDIRRTEKDYKENFDDAKDEYRKWQNKLRNGGYSFESSQEYLDCWGYGLKTATLTYDSFIASKSALEKNVEYSITNLAYQIYLMNKNIAISESNIIKQENDLEIATVKLKYQMITQSSYNEIAQALNTSKLGLVELKNSLESLKINLKSVMGIDILKNVIIEVPDIESDRFEVENIVETVEKSLDTNKDVIAARIEYNAKLNNNILATKTHFLETRDDIKRAKENFEDAEYRLNNVINAVKEEMIVLYNEILANEEKESISKNKLENTITQIEQVNKMYGLGTISKNSFMEYNLLLNKAQLDYENQKVNNLLLRKRWEIAMVVGDIL